MILRFAIDSIINYLRQSLIMVIIMTIGVMLIIFSAMISGGHNYAYRSIDELLSKGVDNTIVLRMEERDPDYVNELANQPEISVIGCSDIYGIEPFPELYEIQKRYKTNTEGCLEIIEINHTASNLCNLNIVKGSRPDNLDYTSRNGKSVEYMYLGSYFSDIPIGTEFETERTVFIVAGILDRSQRWIDESLLYGFELDTMDYTFDCKSSILSFHDGPATSSDMWLCASDNYSIDQAIDIVYRLAEKYNADVRYTTLKTSYERSAQDWIVLNGILSKLIIIVCFSCVLMILCYQIYRLIIMKREMGIMLSVGFSISEISRSLILSNIILSIIAFLVSISLSLYVVKQWFQANDMMEIIHKVLLRYSCPISLSVLACIIVIMSILLTKFLNKLTPLEMIGGQND